MKQLGKKILAVMADVEPLSKDARNDFHKYAYVSDAQVVRSIRNSLISHGLILIPDHTNVVLEGDLTRLSVRYQLIDTDSGETFCSTIVGYGKDSGDKGIYKAMTGAEKYYLTKTFLIPTEDDPEDGKRARRPEEPKQKAAVPQPAKPDGPSNVLVEELLAKLIEINQGDEEAVQEDLKQLTAWKDKNTGEQKWLRITDLPDVAKRKPEWIERIHGKVFAIR